MPTSILPLIIIIHCYCIFDTNRELWRGLWKHLENVATLVDAAVQHMPSDDDTLYLTTKSLLISALWKFAHQPESPEGMSDIPVVIASDSQSQASIRVHLPGIYDYQITATMYMTYT